MRFMPGILVENCGGKMAEFGKFIARDRIERRAPRLNPCSASTCHPQKPLTVVQRRSRMECGLMAKQTNAPKMITWIISLILFVVAIAAHFGFIHVSSDIANWSWIIGYALLLVAVQVRGL
jgi:hypothetical protein